ncbi:histone deacetylase [Actinomadura sp. NBRC 104425]|uniref:histone deacetylase n=1 Tax=Actinomadura sp. NBRC 104425 TaxID=3032204 RepID=UPI002557C591|nr:histone deacetylase [Actinomadura sp. NBRC 104425]
MCADHVWYVAYGSNLARERFSCYLAGGRPEGAMRHYTGCRDPRPARDEKAVTLPGGVYFAFNSLTWGGGMAFYDAELPGRTAARAYLVTREQFCDVMAQEMRREVGADHDLSQALATGRQRIGPGHYETVLKVGERDGYPMLTFTAPHGAGRAVLNAPSAPYLTMLARGLRDAHGWRTGQVAAYLRACPGARGIWSAPAISALLHRADTAAAASAPRASLQAMFAAFRPGPGLPLEPAAG